MVGKPNRDSEYPARKLRNNWKRIVFAGLGACTSAHLRDGPFQCLGRRTERTAHPHTRGAECLQSGRGGRQRAVVDHHWRAIAGGQAHCLLAAVCGAPPQHALALDDTPPRLWVRAALLIRHAMGVVSDGSWAELYLICLQRPCRHFCVFFSVPIRFRLEQRKFRRLCLLHCFRYCDKQRDDGWRRDSVVPAFTVGLASAPMGTPAFWLCQGALAARAVCGCRGDFRCRGVGSLARPSSTRS